MTIKLLDNDLINKIAAGEVIERPASIVKELIENAIDAGACNIAVRIKNGGIDEIQVEDDGSGIDHEEIPVAFLRHATSKISREEDLNTINTMGFRGEALPSIASVSKIEIYTKTKDAPGSRALIEGGMINKLERFATADGTRIIIKDLFFNTPVRKTFLKSPVAEGNNIYAIVCKYALSYPEISFVFDNQKKTQLKTPGNGHLCDTVFTLYGSDIMDHLIDIDIKGSEYSLQGLVSRPDYKRNNRNQGFFFVNKRPVKSPLLTRAVDLSYRGLLVSKEYPVFFLSLDTPADSVDVNIHPQKSEVRFRDEQTVFKFVSGVVAKHLDGSDFRVGNNYHQSSQSAVRYSGPMVSAEVLFEKQTSEQEYQGFKGLFPAGIKTREATENEEEQSFNIIGQLADSFILAEKDNSLLIIDQHAAHERIWYNKLTRIYKSDSVRQMLVLPLAMDLSSDQVDLLESRIGVLTDLGFEIDIVGHNSIILRAVPNFIIGKEWQTLITILDLAKEGEADRFKDEILISMSCEKAVTANTRLSTDEMAKIVSDLFREDNYKNCPHGRPTIIYIDHADLLRMFKR